MQAGTLSFYIHVAILYTCTWCWLLEADRRISESCVVTSDGEMVTMRCCTDGVISVDRAGVAGVGGLSGSLYMILT